MASPHYGFATLRQRERQRERQRTTIKKYPIFYLEVLYPI